MAKPEDINASLVKGIEAVDQVINGAVTVGVTATPVDTGGRDINWIILFNNGTAAVYAGASTVTTANGFPIYQRGNMPVLRVTALDVIYLISGTAGQDVRYIAGVK